MITDMEEQDRVSATRRYYEKNKLAIIRKKTLVKVRTTGRVPREKTLEKNCIDRDDVNAAMDAYLLKT